MSSSWGGLGAGGSTFGDWVLLIKSLFTQVHDITTCLAGGGPRWLLWPAIA